ncbi:hypothetical protein LINPERPRIM_LOCUS14569, partial [Linum perenne]
MQIPPILKEFRLVYSPKIFTKFQEEYANCMELIKKGGLPLLTEGVAHAFTWSKFRISEHSSQSYDHTVTCMHT